jgi:hypothetical protein
MKRYFFTSHAATLEAVSRAMAHGIDDMHISNCSGDEFGFFIDMDLAGYSLETEQNITATAANEEPTP